MISDQIFDRGMELWKTTSPEKRGGITLMADGFENRQFWTVENENTEWGLFFSLVDSGMTPNEARELLREKSNLHAAGMCAIMI